MDYSNYDEVLNAIRNGRLPYDFNDWGYALMESEELEKALEVFKLNTILFPDSWNVYDSYGEALMKSNRKEESIEMYEKSIAMNPENENGKEMLLKIKQE